MTFSDIQQKPEIIFINVHRIRNDFSFNDHFSIRDTRFLFFSAIEVKSKYLKESKKHKTHKKSNQ